MERMKDFMFTGLILMTTFLSPLCVSGSRHKYLNITGDFLVGGMFPVHGLGESGQCSHVINEQDGIQNVEAFMYMLDEINNYNFLPGFEIGTLIEDTCYSDTVALERSLAYVRRSVTSLDDEHTLVCDNGNAPAHLKSGRLIGVVGAATSSVSIQLASFLRLFRMPQISYLSTSPELNDNKRYEYFLRTVPSDVYQAQAIVEILSRFNWTYVTGIYEDTSYGEQGFAQIVHQAGSRDICIAYKKPIKRYFKTEADKVRELESVVDDLNMYNNTNGTVVVIAFTSFRIVETLFDIVYNRSQQHRFIWIGSDAWSGKDFLSESQKVVAENCIAVQLLVKVIPQFDEYFKNLTVKNNKRNPWFEEYVNQLPDCNYNASVESDNLGNIGGAVENCVRNSSDKGGFYNRNLNTYTTMNALRAYAVALKKLHADRCGGKPGVCDEMANITGKDVFPFLQDVNFTDPAGLEFYFVNSRNGPARYSVTSYVKTQGEGYRWVEVGQFLGSGLENITNDKDYIVWNETITSLAHYTPSRCSDPCPPGYSRSHRQQCCWTCTPCATYQYIQRDTCMDCPEGEKPNQLRNACETIPEAYMSYENPWAIMSLLISGCGMLCTIVIGVIFYRNKDTPVIMASGKELSFVLLGGIFFSYTSSFFFVAFPTGFTCGSTRVMLGLSYTVCYAAILLKTNRIARVFNVKTKKPKKIRFTSTRSQLLITAAIVMVEVAALVAWLAFEPPTHCNIYPTRADNIRVCKDSKDFSYLGALVYPFLLMILCIVFAVRTRKTPDGFNETRYIAFGSYSFCVMWLAFIPIYFSISSNTIRIICLCMASVVNATVTLITLFVTKAYLVIFRPQKNTKEYVMSRRFMPSSDAGHNLSNLSKIAGGVVSTWNSSRHPSLYDSEGPPSPRNETIRRESTLGIFGNELQVSTITGAAVNQTQDGHRNPSVMSADPEMLEVERHQKADTTQESSKMHVSSSEGDLVDGQSNSRRMSNGYKQKFARLRSFKPSSAKKATISKRPASIEVGPAIIATSPSEEHVERL